MLKGPAARQQHDHTKNNKHLNHRLRTAVINFTGVKNIREDTQEMPQSRNTGFPKHQKKGRWGANKSHIYNHQCIKSCNRGTAFDRSVKKKILRGVWVDLNQIYSRETSTWFWCSSKLQFMFGLHRGPLSYLWNITMKHIYDKHCDETKQGTRWRSKTKTQTNHKQIKMPKPSTLTNVSSGHKTLIERRIILAAT